MIAHLSAGQLAGLVLWFGWLLAVLAVAVLAVTRPAGATSVDQLGHEAATEVAPPLVLVGPAVVVIPAELAD